MKPIMKISYPIILITMINLFMNCTNYEVVEKIPKGATKERILIKSYPTKARIFVDNKYLGKTPIKTDLWYFKPKKVNIVAEPIFEGQIPQNLVMAIPSVPDKIVFYMNFNPETYYDYEQEQDTVATKQDSSIANAGIREVVKIEKRPLFLPIIYFETDKASLQKGNKDKLDELAGYLQASDSIHLEINGYASQPGSSEYNKKLSLKRAMSVYNYLTEQGIDEGKLEVFGHGESRIINRKSVELEYQKSQRVEFDLIKRQ